MLVMSGLVRSGRGGTMSLATLKNKRERGFFDGQFLIAMPGMEDRNFARTVIYICAHSMAGGWGSLINRPKNRPFPVLLCPLKIIREEDPFFLPPHPRVC